MKPIFVTIMNTVTVSQPAYPKRHTGFIACPTLRFILTLRKLPFECQKIAKNLTFKKKIDKKCHYFSKKIAKFWKKLQFLSIFFLNVKFLVNFLTLKWQFSRGSGVHQLYLHMKTAIN